MNLLHRVPVHLHHVEHRLLVVAIPRERPHVGRYLTRRQVALPVQQRRQRAADAATGVAVVGNPHRHQQTAQVRVAQPQRTEQVRVLGDRRRRITGMIDQDLLRCDVNRTRPAEPLNVERAVLTLHLLEVDARQVARRIVQEHVLAARVRRIDRPRPLTRVPVVDRRLVLQARIAAVPRPFGDLAHQLAGRITRPFTLGIGHPVRRPVLIILDRLHEPVADANRQIRVLEHDRRVRLSVEVRFVLAAVDQRAGLLLFLGLAPNEFADIRMPVLDRLHLRRAARLAAGFHHGRNLIVHPHKGQRAGRCAAARQLLAAGANRGDVSSRPGTELEQHGLRGGQPHDRLHVVVDRLDEARRRLRILVRRLRPLHVLRLPVPVVVPAATLHAVLVKQTDVEPHRRIECPVLMQAQPGQFAVKILAILNGGEVAVFDAPIGNRARDPVDHLADAGFAFGSSWLAIEILGDDDIRCQRAPAFRNFAFCLLKQNLPIFVFDLRRAAVPFHRVERRLIGRAEVRFDPLSFVGFLLCQMCAVCLLQVNSLSLVHRALLHISEFQRA